jgi:hypothetical protein
MTFFNFTKMLANSSSVIYDLETEAKSNHTDERQCVGDTVGEAIDVLENSGILRNIEL